MQAATAVVVLCILISGGFYLVASYRDYVADDREITPEALANLLEMHRKGDISDQEIRTIQARTQQHFAGPIANDVSTDSDESSPNTPS
ncbi:hypothetical protein [Rubripirellula lacrimiformis]|uniref:hypothetical protein n=1 Tax=Rubripirellula lacrimiformis TaxID=1930273 RepID=UPI001C54E0D0|nr:hypothetical protein [Rubripirellula lacrimiformis]